MRILRLEIWTSSICALAFCCSTYGQESPLIPEPETGQLQSVEGVLDRTDDNEFVERLASENTPLRIPYGNKDVAQKLGACYAAGGWYAPPGVDLAAFRAQGWL